MTSGNNINLVYTMGKVGSSSVFRTLRKLLSTHEEVYTIHFLSDYFLKEFLPKANPLNSKGYEKGFAIREYIESNPDKRLKIITLVRDPLMRDLSEIFQKWELNFGNASTDEVSLVDLKKRLDAQHHDHPLKWFDTEFKAYLNWDIYQHPFDQEKGYQIYQTEDFDLLCMRLENLDDCYREAIHRFLGLDIPALLQANKREDTPHKDLYLQLKSTYKAPPQKLEKLYTSKYVTHFYSPEEIAAFREKWGEKMPIASDKVAKRPFWKRWLGK